MSKHAVKSYLEVYRKNRDNGRLTSELIVSHPVIHEELRAVSGIRSNMAFASTKMSRSVVSALVVMSDFTELAYTAGTGDQCEICFWDTAYEVLERYGQLDEIDLTPETLSEWRLGFMAAAPSRFSAAAIELEPLIESGRAALMPHAVVLVPQEDPDRFSAIGVDSIWTYAQWVQHALQQKQPGDTRLEASSELDNKSVEIAMPFLDGVSFKTLAQVLDDNQGHLAALRGAIRKVATELGNGEKDGRALVGDLVQPELDRLTQEFGRVTAVRSLRVAGAVVGTAAAAIVAAVNPVVLPAASAILGGVGVAAISREIAGAIDDRAKVKQSPWYVLWRLSR